MSASPDRIYLRVSLIVLAVLVPLAPPSVERQLLRHIREVVKIAEKGLEERPNSGTVAGSVRSYLDSNGTRINRLKSYLDAYDAQRSLVAYRRLEPGIEALGRLAREHPELGEDVFQALWDLMP